MHFLDNYRASWVLFFLSIIMLQCSSNTTNIYQQKIAELPNTLRAKLPNNFAKQAALGHLLFFDTKLSLNNSKSCASCHNPDLYFTDGYKRTLGAYADIQLRNTPSLINSSSFKTLNWADPNITTFAQQMQTPLFSKAHLEMGMNPKNNKDAKAILLQPQYASNIIIQDTANIDWNTIIECISAYCMLLNSRNSIWDLKKKTRSKEAEIGRQLFFGNKYNCSKCHGGLDFMTPIHDSLYFSNIQLYNSKQYNNLLDKGLFNTTNIAADIGEFRIPSLRNVAHTAPYAHDGSQATLAEVFSKPGHYNYFVKSNLLMPKADQYALVKFLELLSDTSIPNQQLFQNPYSLKK